MEKRDTQSKKAFLVIHGHFYQPPRENPWAKIILKQESAKPFHDWNERIATECYNPNTRSRVLDERGKITHLVNNFEYLNFNIGPTLFSWIEQHAPDVYQRILNADETSRALNNGHGNAIAQVYNHIILPLANRRDRRTQILWGKREFQRRFGRDPEAMWLSETAIDQETVRELIGQGFEYVILSPTQAQQVRPFTQQTWQDVSQNTIDTTQPYRIVFRRTPRLSYISGYNAPSLLPRHAFFASRITYRAIHKNRRSRDAEVRRSRLDAFFYHGPLSVDMSFNHLLRDAGAFAQRLREIGDSLTHSDVLAHVATDGEIYGHHEPFADMCLSSAVTSQFSARQLEITNYARYLEEHPPTMEVELKTGGANHEGTAWSCAHGVGRWYRDCGCRIGNLAGWNQQWRTPLRKGFDVLRDALAQVFEQFTEGILYHPWAARDAYIECLLDPSEQTVNAFLKKHALRPLNEEEQSLILRLLEAQKYSMFSYTSCAWFFDDISGIEITQNMRYAARAIQLVEDLPGTSRLKPNTFEALMLAEFEQATSNLPAFGTGKDIYLRYVKPDVYTPERAVNQFLLSHLVEQMFPESSAKSLERLKCGDTAQVYIYRLECLECGHDSRLFPSQGLSGYIRVQDTTTRQQWTISFAAFMPRRDHPVSYLKQGNAAALLTRIQATMAHQISLATLEKDLAAHGFHAYTFADLYEDDREKLFYTMAQRSVERLDTHIAAIYRDSRELLARLAETQTYIPLELQPPIAFALSHQLRKEMHALRLDAAEVSSTSPFSKETEDILHLSRTHRIQLDKRVLQQYLSRILLACLKKLRHQVRSVPHSDAAPPECADTTLSLMREIESLLKYAEEFDVPLEMTEAQNIAFDLFGYALQAYCSRDSLGVFQSLKHLVERLNFNLDRYQPL